MAWRAPTSMRVCLCLGAGFPALLAAGCKKDREMAEQMEMPDRTQIMEALGDEIMMDSMLDVMPGGEMVRGDSAAAERLLMRKLQ